MEPTPFTAIARVVKTHGVAGEVSCTELEGALDELPSGLEVWFVPPPDGPRQASMLSVRQGPKGALVTLAGVDSIEQARALVGTLMLAKTSELPAEWLAMDVPDVVGLSVSDESRGFLGLIKDTIMTGANDVWVVDEGPFGEVLIPVIDDVVLSVDEASGTARVRLLPGLIDEE